MKVDVLDSFYNDTFIIVHNKQEYQNLQKGSKLLIKNRMATIEEMILGHRKNRIGIKIKYKN